MKTLLFASFLLALFAGCLAQNRSDVPFQVIAKGQYSGENDQGLKVFRTERAMEEFSKDRAQDLPKRLIKDVDWEKEQVLVIFGGQQSSGGYSVTVKRIASVDIQRLQVEAILHRPSPDSINTQALTTPYIVIKMARQVAVVKVKFVSE